MGDFGANPKGGEESKSTSEKSTVNTFKICFEITQAVPDPALFGT
jgi:hypothetical protein